MGWKVVLEHGGSKLRFITYLKSNSDLGHFLLNLDNDYEIISTTKVIYDEVRRSQLFIKKDTNIEFGKTKKGEN